MLVLLSAEKGLRLRKQLWRKHSFLNFIFIKLERQKARVCEVPAEPLKVVNRGAPIPPPPPEGKHCSKQVRTTKLSLGFVPLTSEKYMPSYSCFNFLTLI